jgi:hypothetical protein
MLYVHALEILTGLPWQVAGKIWPLLADLVSQLSGRVPRLGVGEDGSHEPGEEAVADGAGG